MAEGVLVLWDVDQTLVNVRGVGVEALVRGFRRVYGRDLVELPVMAGRTDLAIILDALRAHGLPAEPARLEEFRVATELAFAELDGDLRARGRALPGALDALVAVRAVAAVQSLLTGNIRAVAEAKLRAFGLDGHVDFDLGAYGWSHAVRARLVEVARAAALRRYADAFAGRRTVLIGDTPRDVEAALDSGAGVVAVATGRYTAAELDAAGAHAVLPDLTATDEVRAAVLRVSGLNLAS